MAQGIIELLRIFLAIAIAGLCGGGFVVALCPTRKTYISILAVAPLVGLSLLGTLGTLFYIFGLTARVAISLAILTLSLTTIVGFVFTGAFRAYRRDLIHLFSIFVILGTVAGFICDSPALLGEGPALIMRDGTDSMGYAMNAQVLLDHRSSDVPISSPNPYYIIPSINLHGDNRLSTYVIVAAGTLLAGRPAFFAYDFVCSVVLASVLLALAGLSWMSPLPILLAGLLLLGDLPDFATTGFLGKLLAYPSIIVVISLLIWRIEAANRWLAVPLMALTVYAVSVTALQSMVPEFCFVAAASFCFFLYTLAKLGLLHLSSDDSDARETANLVGATVLLPSFILFCIIASGAVLANISGALLPDVTGISQVRSLSALTAFSPQTLWSMAQDIELRGAPVVKHSEVLSIVGDGAHLVLLLASVLSVDGLALTLLVAPPTFIGLAIGLRLYWAAHEAVGFIYMAEVVAAGLLLMDLFKRPVTASEAMALRRRHVVLAGAVLSSILVIGVVHIPKALFSLDQYVKDVPETFIYRQLAFEEMAKVIVDKKFTVDTMGLNVPLAQPLLAYFGALGYDVRFTRDSWLFANWGHAYPPGSDDSNFRITPANSPIPTNWSRVYRDTRYAILRRDFQR